MKGMLDRTVDEILFTLKSIYSQKGLYIGSGWGLAKLRDLGEGENLN